jgi:hypothetical protein
MNIPNSKDQLEQLVIRYLYGDFSDEEKAQFEQELTGNSLLQEVLAQEQHLNASVPQGTAPFIDSERQEDNRLKLRRNLQKQVASQSALSVFLVSLLRKPSLVAFQSFALAASYVLGFLIASPSDVTVESGNPLAGIVSPLSLVGDQDYEISDMHIADFNPVSGEIDLSFSIASETQLSGNVADTGIRTLMTVALLNEIDAAARLDTIEALQNATFNDDVSASMIYVLNSDNNPGVRYSAVRSLVDYADDENVRTALRNALTEDVNPGVRIEAFKALAENPDAETLAVFRQRMDVDSNTFIRDRSRSIVEGDTDNNLPTDIF